MRHKLFRSAWLARLLCVMLAVPQAEMLSAQAPATTAKAPTTPAPATTNTAPPPATSVDPGWPRAIELESGAAVWYQPQIESWDQKQIVAWSAIAYTPKGAKEPALGTIKIEGPTRVSADDRVVSMDLSVTEYTFKTLSPEQVKALVAAVQARPQHERVIDIDRVLAYVDSSALKVRDTPDMKADPPRIFWSQSPAILVNFDGEPVWSPIENLDLRYAVNTNWDLFEHTTSNIFYLRNNDSWFQASTAIGPWTPLKGKLPASFSKLPPDENWKEVKAAVPGRTLSAKSAPQVFVTTEPSELIVLQGVPSYLKVDNTKTLLWVHNTEADLFRNGFDGDFYFLVAGRWFKAPTLDGPWRFATPDLPEDFKNIPVEHSRSRVLASIPGTSQATEAVLLALIPRTARVSKKQLQAPQVDYFGGPPQFKSIQGTGLEQAVNTDKDVIKFGDLYYMCFQGVWFMSRSATGPWEVSSSVPKEIYTIPTSSPVHHVTYVTVEDDDDEWVTFAYVAAYTGVMVGWGCAMWGSGWYYPPYYYGGIYYPYMHTYGMGAWYNPWTGAYGRGYAAYGPYGGVGVGASYNPRTGTYARGAAAYGPYGSRSAAQAYNPRTGTYGQTRQGSNIYGNWGSSYVQRGDQWAQTAHRQNNATGRTTSGVRTSSGGGAVSSSGAGGRTTVGRTAGGDYYAGRDGNVYRRNEGGGWEQTGSVGNRPEPRTGTGQTSTGQTSTGTRSSSGGIDSGQASQLDRDRNARTSGNQRTAERSNWYSGGSTRSGAGSYGGGRSRAGGGGGRRR
jgi:hypothetical protein